ncbi:hypothetical protein SEA_YARA_95 [Streptomyces phage Yara]|nr:hypothetical protein SEA_YARA_95 [Streptomyces phage Yara]
MDITYSIPGYEVIGEIDLSIEDMDSEAVALLLWDDETGLGLLWAQGCTCCGDMMDQLVPSEARVVEDLMATAQELYDAASVADDEEAVDNVRESLRAAVAKMGPRAPKELC